MNKVKNKSQAEKKSVSDNDFIMIAKETIG
jgi:hypothetical protein